MTNLHFFGSRIAVAKFPAAAAAGPLMTSLPLVRQLYICYVGESNENARFIDSFFTTNTSPIFLKNYAPEMQICIAF